MGQNIVDFRLFASITCAMISGVAQPFARSANIVNMTKC